MKQLFLLLKKNIQLILAGITLLFLIKAFDVKNISDVSSFFSWELVGVSIGIYFFVKIINTYRYKFFFEIKRFTKPFLVLCFSNFMLNILPFRAGELSYIQMFKKYFDINYEKSVTRLIVMRGFDYIAVVTLFALSVFFVGLSVVKENIKIENVYFNILFIFGVIFIGYICYRIFFLLIKKSNPIALRILKYFRIFIKNIHDLSKKDLIRLLIMSLIYWFLRILMGYLILLILGINPGFWVIVFISMVLMVVDSLPIRTAGGFGIFEGGWTLLLGYWGYQGGDVFLKILVFHFLILISAVFFGAVARSILSLKYKTLNNHI